VDSSQASQWDDDAQNQNKDSWQLHFNFRLPTTRSKTQLTRCGSQNSDVCLPKNNILHGCVAGFTGIQFALLFVESQQKRSLVCHSHS